MKKIIVFFIGILFIMHCSAQLSNSKNASSWQFEAGPIVAVPFQFLHLFSSFGIGADLAALHPVSDKLSAGGRTNLTHFFGKKLSGVPGATHYDGTTIIDLMGEVNYTFDNDLVIGGDLGVGFAIKTGGTNTQLADNLYLGYQFSAKEHPLIISVVVNTTHTQKSVGLRGNIRF